MGELLMAFQTPYEDISEFFDLLNLCRTSNFCKFGDFFFDFPSEVRIPIGSPLGSLISEVFMDKFENDLFSLPSGLLGRVTYRFRYVDDVLCLWNGTQSLAKVFLQLFNLFFPLIEFTNGTWGNQG